MRFITGLLLRVKHLILENSLLDGKQIVFELDNDCIGV